MMHATRSLAEELVPRLTTRFPLTESLQGVERDFAAASPDHAELVVLMTRLFDPNLPPIWLEALWPTTRLIIASVATGLGVESHVRRDLLHELARLRGLRSRPNGAQPALSCVATPFAAFHWAGWCRAGSRQPTPYIAVAGLVHLRARALEHTMRDEAKRFGRKLADRRWDYLKAARDLCRYGPSLSAMTLGFRRSLIDACGLDA